ncbi:hypothetical protein JG687_00007449 [Phytophthora cactorum]|uniref:RXLR phytopathogen effector protein WY-domain domain-containing protein n=1 Tax=Phytophthora cactorum TaxID=29920 RepID=A0A8T1UGL9_9STRA|nr:hypothetical protein GQ600_3334 [Phytophthora cactorum]KAG6961912.1 hypothetical protein JG687_00007449 [Phytophthora cactorum]
MRTHYSTPSKLDALSNILALKMGTNLTKLFKRDSVLKADDTGFIQQLQYVIKYRVKREGKYLYTNKELFGLLKITQSEAELVTLFQSLRQHFGVKNLENEMQAYMILKHVSSRSLVAGVARKPNNSPFSDVDTLDLLLKKKWLMPQGFGALIESLTAIPDVKTYGNLKAYTEYYYGYAKHQGGTDLLKKVETLIIDGKLHATIAVASNSVAKNSS